MALRPAICRFALLLTGALYGCSDSCREYSAYSCDELEAAQYNVYFFFPGDQKEYFLGEAEGLPMCGSMARSYAVEKEVTSSKWGYICCLKTPDSQCAEKHR